MDYKFDKKVTAELLSDSSTYAFILLCIILSYLPENQDDLAEVDVEELLIDLEEEFKCKIPEENENKINAAITALTTDLFYRSSSAMKAIALSFSDGDIGDIANGGDEDVEACEILWAALEVGLINDTSFIESVAEFSPHVMQEVNKILDNESEDSEVDELDEMMRDPYYHKYISYHIMQLTSQLVKLGVESSIIKDIWIDYTSSVDQLI